MCVCVCVRASVNTAGSIYDIPYICTSLARTYVSGSQLTIASESSPTTVCFMMYIHMYVRRLCCILRAL